MSTYSVSSLGTYETCPRQYRFAYLDRKEAEEETIENFRGNRVHDTMKWLYDEVRHRNHPSLGELVRYFVSRWQKEWHSSLKIVKAQYKQEDYEARGIEMLIHYYQGHYPIDASSTVHTEMYVTPKLVDAETGEVLFGLRGRIDRLDKVGSGLYEIHDYKTSDHLPSQDELDKERQLALYELGLRQQFQGLESVELVWHYMAHDEEMRSRRTPEQLQDLAYETVQLIRAIESDTEFPPKESRLCDWCAYQALCPAKRHPFEVDRLTAEQFLADEGVSLVNAFAE